jgi:Beta-lactamase enzyme family
MGLFSNFIDQIAKLAPFAKAPTVSFTRGGKLQTCLDALSGNADFNAMGIALVDLTHAPGVIAYAGLRDRRQLFGASLVKIAAMFAAYALREDVREAESVIAAKDRADLFAKLEGAWKPLVETNAAKSPKDFPKFAAMFDPLSRPLDFTAEFKKHLEKMIHKSDNESAAECIHRVGYQYLNGALRSAGLFDTVGLWMGGDYVDGDYAKKRGYKDFVEIPIDKDANPRIHAKIKMTSQGATAEAVAKFLVLVEIGKLVSAGASREMQALMAGQLLESDFKEGLIKPPLSYTLDRIYGKIGIEYGVGDDCAVIERRAVVRASPRLEKTIKYAAVGLREPVAYNLKKLIRALDDCVVKNNSP